jgi:AAA ATPase domain
LNSNRREKGSPVLKLRIFVSSPGDVGAERAVALAVAERLQLEFRGRVELHTYLWERSVLRATDTFQAQILNIEEADLALFILWARLGTPLPLEQFARPDGSQYQSGTEYEFERAREGYEKNHKPDILCYLKTAEVRLSLKDRGARAQQFAELDAVSAFVDKWFRSADGTFKGAFYNFEKPAQFEELVEAHLRDWIRQRLRGDGPADEQRSLWEGSPFRGLQSFDYEHALIYCGRTAMVSEVLDALRRRGAAGHGFLMVTGMSGVGKSSLVRAGVLPLLTRPRVIEHVIGWRRAMFWPNVSHQGLLAGFAAALTAEYALPELAEATRPVEALLRDPPALTVAIAAALDRATRLARESSPEPDPESMVRLIIVVDQFEEIFDETVTTDERAAFVEALRTLIATGRVWVIATLRADFFSRTAELPERFRDLFIERDGIFTVGGPRPAEIAQMIRRPAMMAGLTFEQRGDPEEGLDDVLRDAAAGNATVLPLLEFTLDELWRRSAGSGVLRFADYEAIGGLHGALRLRADEELARLPAHVRAALPKVLAAMVHTDPTDERLILQNRVLLSQFDHLPDCRQFIDAFVDAHLLVADVASDGTPVIAFAHEALLREWPPAVKWIEQNRELLRLRAGITAAAALWRNSNRAKNRLMVGALLKDAAKVLKDYPEMLAIDERQYVELSRAETRRHLRRQVRRAALAAATVALAIFIATIGLRQVSYGLSFVGTLPKVWNSDGKALPLSASARTNLDASTGALATALHKPVGEVGRRPELNAWGVAQIWTALHGLHPSLAKAGPELRAFMSQARDATCRCWRETPDKLPHALVTAWVLYSLARYDQAATPEEIAPVLSAQRTAGWWSVFPATEDDKNASTSATAWTILALHSQLEKGLIVAAQGEQVREAIRKGAAWLTRRATPGRARWTEYPTVDFAEGGGEYLAVSAFAIHVLRTVSANTQFDGLWLETLPRDVPPPGHSEISKAAVLLGGPQFTLDESRHYQFPWMLVTTVETYRNGTTSQKARALVWVEEALRRPLTAEEIRWEHIMAEVLIALRHVEAAVGEAPDGARAAPAASAR